MVEEFGLYLGRDKKKCQPLDIPNYYIGWVKGIGIIFHGIGGFFRGRLN